VEKPPNTLLFGLFPAFQANPLPQFLMTDAVVNNAITSKEKDDVEEQKRIVDQNNIELSNANAELAKAIIPIVSASITIDSTSGKVTENAESRALITAAKQSPVLKKILLASSDLSAVIKDFVDKGAVVVASTGVFTDPGTGTSPAPDPKKSKLAPTS